jgi:integrase
VPRRPGAQIIRRQRADRSTTYSLRVRVGGADARLPLGNTNDGWDEARVERAREQLLAKIKLGLWTPPSAAAREDAADEEPTFRELASNWYHDRERNPAIRASTLKDDHWRLTRYLLPFFGELRPSEITPVTIKEYRRRIHEENAQISAARQAGAPILDRRNGLRLRPLGNESINKTLRTLGAVLDEAVDAGWIAHNVARGPRMREAVRRRKGEILTPEEFGSLLDAASELDAGGTLIPPTADRHPDRALFARGGVRRAIVATLGLAGLRVSELCDLDVQHIHLTAGKIHVPESKTDAGVRAVDIRPRLLEELKAYRAASDQTDMTAPAFPTRTGGRRDKDNVRERVLYPVVRRANQRRVEHGQPSILVHVTPHTLRRTYISFMLAAGFDLPYVQEQVGHLDPSTTLKIYAQVIRRPDRDRLRAEMQELLGEASHDGTGNGPKRPHHLRMRPNAPGRPHTNHPASRGFAAWARLGSNQRPLACEASALPLSYAPFRVRFYASDLHGRLAVESLRAGPDSRPAAPASFLVNRRTGRPHGRSTGDRFPGAS